MYMKILIIVLLQIISNTLSADFSLLRQAHRHQNVESDAELEYLSDLTNNKYTDSLLDQILIPRVVGTPNHDKVRNIIKNQLKLNGFDVEIDSFEAKTPMGLLNFDNIIGTLNPNAERFLVLACHYDSKFFKDVVFVGATDSAVPCAMMLNLAKVMKNELENSKSNNKVSLKLVFLDGEEAFVEWGPNDSIYGAKHLSKKWHKNTIPHSIYGKVSDLERVDAFVLLDLLGTPNPVFYSYFKNTERWYSRLVLAETRLRNLGLFYGNDKTYFQNHATPSYVEDDHIPFLRKGVPILHIIPKNFPKEWHTPADNRNAIDMNTIENLNKIFRVFVSEYLHLNIANLITEESDDENQHTEF